MKQVEYWLWGTPDQQEFTTLVNKYKIPVCAKFSDAQQVKSELAHWYKKKVLVEHPDKHPGHEKEATAITQQVITDYEKLLILTLRIAKSEEKDISWWTSIGNKIVAIIESLRRIQSMEPFSKEYNAALLCVYHDEW